MSFPTILTLTEMRALTRRWHHDGQTIGFVPTMGALHDGHLALVREAKESCDRVVVSIFVNPLQFGPSEDFARYPRTLAADVEKLQTVGVDALFAPNAMEMYPAGFQTSVVNNKMSEGLCGEFRPGHFEGVLTVVLKLFQAVDAHHAFFGKKDYQQWRVIERMALDLFLRTQVHGCETLRESDGLAMSSRNRYLSVEQRAQATLIYQGLTDAAQSWRAGERSRNALLKKFQERIALCKDMRIQYVQLVHAKDLSQVSEQVDETPLAMITAVLYGDVRLIDNLEFGGQS